MTDERIFDPDALIAAVKNPPRDDAHYIGDDAMQIDPDKLAEAVAEGVASGEAGSLDLDALADEAFALAKLDDRDLMRRALAAVEATQPRWSHARMAFALGRNGGHVIREIMSGKRSLGGATQEVLAFVLRDGPLTDEQVAAALKGAWGLEYLTGPAKRALAHRKLFGPLESGDMVRIFAALPDATPKGGRPGRPPIAAE